uniref:Uncharacterized protein n=1 Tax=Plectus sambesii TaxID=2011161 RepID=A0A914VJB1_9BILA
MSDDDDDNDDDGVLARSFIIKDCTGAQTHNSKQAFRSAGPAPQSPGKQRLPEKVFQVQFFANVQTERTKRATLLFLMRVAVERARRRRRRTRLTQLGHRRQLQRRLKPSTNNTSTQKPPSNDRRLKLLANRRAGAHRQKRSDFEQQRLAMAR